MKTKWRYQVCTHCTEMKIVEVTWWIDILFKDKVILSKPNSPILGLFDEKHITYELYLFLRSMFDLKNKVLQTLRLYSNINWLTCRTMGPLHHILLRPFIYFHCIIWTELFPIIARSTWATNWHQVPHQNYQQYLTSWMKMFCYESVSKWKRAWLMNEEKSLGCFWSLVHLSLSPLITLWFCPQWFS